MHPEVGAAREVAIRDADIATIHPQVDAAAACRGRADEAHVTHLDVAASVLENERVGPGRARVIGNRRPLAKQRDIRYAGKRVNAAGNLVIARREIEGAVAGHRGARRSNRHLVVGGTIAHRAVVLDVQDEVEIPLGGADVGVAVDGYRPDNSQTAAAAP